MYESNYYNSIEILENQTDNYCLRYLISLYKSLIAEEIVFDEGVYEELLCCLNEYGIDSTMLTDLENFAYDVLENQASKGDIIFFFESLFRRIGFNIENSFGTDCERSQLSYSEWKQNNNFEIIDEKSYQYVIGFIKNQKYRFSKYDIEKTIGFQYDSFINRAIESEISIIKFGKEYIWIDNMNISDSDKSYIYDMVLKNICDKQAHSIYKIYDYCLLDNLDFINRYSICDAIALYGIVRALFETEFEFENNLIAQKGIKIPSTYDRINQFTSGKQRINVQDLFDFAKENYIPYSSTVELLKIVSRTYILINKQELIIADASLKKLAQEIEQIISEEVLQKEYMGICELTQTDTFPEIELEWNEWIIYSLISKWGIKLKVATTTNDFRNAIPVIYVGNTISQHRLEIVSTRCKEKKFGAGIDAKNVDSVMKLIMDDYISNLSI